MSSKTLYLLVLFLTCMVIAIVSLTVVMVEPYTSKTKARYSWYVKNKECMQRVKDIQEPAVFTLCMRKLDIFISIFSSLLLVYAESKKYRCLYIPWLLILTWGLFRQSVNFATLVNVLMQMSATLLIITYILFMQVNSTYGNLFLQSVIIIQRVYSSHETCKLKKHVTV